MTSNQLNPQPLLAEATDSEAPALLGGAAQPSDMEQSPLERLIAQSTSEQAAAGPPPGPLLLEEEPSGMPYPTTNEVVARPPITKTVSTLIAAPLGLLHVALVWASFLSNAWFDTHLTVVAQYSEESQFSEDEVLHKTTLASLLSTFLGADLHWAAIVLVLTCLVLPCLFMILCPTWIAADYQEPSKRDSMPWWFPRSVLEYVMRISLLAFFILTILDVGTSSIALSNGHTEMFITNRTRGGLVSYTMGTTCGIGLILVLRLGEASFWRRELSSTRSTPRFQYQRQARPQPPPTQAFQLPWRNDRGNVQNDDLQAPLLADETSAQRELDASLQIDTSSLEGHVPQGLSFFQKMMLYEFGMLSVVLWVPALFVPLFQVTFEGVVASFMEDVSLMVHFYELPVLLWQRGIAAGTDHWMVVLLTWVFFSLVYLFPFLATCLTVASWRAAEGSKESQTYRNCIRVLQPFLCGIVFALSLMVGVPAFEAVGKYVLEEETSGFCTRFENVTDVSCLTIHGHDGPGQWYLLGQSVALEIYIFMTLAWKK